MFNQTNTPTVKTAETVAQQESGTTCYRYEVTAETLQSEELGTYHSFGIRVIASEEREVDFVSDVSTEREAVRRLADLCTARQLEPEHFREVVEDFLNESPAEA